MSPNMPLFKEQRIYRPCWMKTHELERSSNYSHFTDDVLGWSDSSDTKQRRGWRAPWLWSLSWKHLTSRQTDQGSACILRTKCYLLCSRPPGLLEQILPGHRWDGACGQIRGTVLCKRPSWSGWTAGGAGADGHLAKWSGPAGTARGWR